jgi:hypothetical protein
MYKRKTLANVWMFKKIAILNTNIHMCLKDRYSHLPLGRKKLGLKKLGLNLQLCNMHIGRLIELIWMLNVGSKRNGRGGS